MVNNIRELNRCCEFFENVRGLVDRANKRGWDISISGNDKFELLGDILINISPNSWIFINFQ